MKRGVVDGEYQDGELRGLTFLAGQRGMGKTTEMARLLDGCAGGVLFFDTVGTHGRLLRGYKTLTQPGPLKEYLRVNHGRRFRIRYVPDEDHAEAHFVAVCQIVRAVGWMVFAVDEIDSYCDPKYGETRMPPELYKLVHFGRHRTPTAMLFTARDPASLSIRVRSQCAVFRIFRTDEERYVDYFAGRIGKANAAKLASLPQFHYLLWVSGIPDAQIRGGRRTL